MLNKDNICIGEDIIVIVYILIDGEIMLIMKIVIYKVVRIVLKYVFEIVRGVLYLGVLDMYDVK